MRYSGGMKRGFIVFVAAMLTMAVFAPAQVAHADVNDFTVTSFTADDTLDRADAQGELRIVEHINVDFTNYNHGILRAIPNSYKGHRLQLHVNKVSSDSNAPARYTTYQSGGNTVLKIGDPNRTVTGQQEYTLDYTVRNVISFYGDHDELYWDINGDQWDQPFEVVSLRLHLPAGLQLAFHDPLCYTGSFGDASHNCEIYQNRPHVLATQTFAELSAGQTLSVAVGFQRGYFHPSRWYETAGEYSRGAIEFAVPFVLIAGLAAVYWWRRGRDPKGTGIIVPEYEPPDGLRPIEVGTLIDFRTDNKDITATIIDLAVRGYIRIIQRKVPSPIPLVKDKQTYVLELRKTDLSRLTGNERELLSAIFPVTDKVGETVDLDMLKNQLATSAVGLRKSVTKELIASGYIKPMPRLGLQAGSLRPMIFGSIWVALIVIGAIHASGSAGAGAIAGLLVALLFLAFMSSRTQKGVTTKEHIQGLKLFLKVTETQRLKMLQSPNAPYAAKTQAPERTVDLFEKLLPYAMVLGVENEWAKQFKDIYRTPPDWYQGNWSTFSVLYLTSSINSSFVGSVNSAFSPAASASGSGFGGGGAGGGGGGGGGGGW
jgi:predicted membrane protein DUF2207